MIAHFRLALSAELHVVAEEPLPQLEMELEHEGLGSMKVDVSAPYRSRLSESVFRVGGSEPLLADADKLDPADPQPLEPGMEISGKGVVACDAIVVEIHRDEFDRSRTRVHEIQTTLLAIAVDAANLVLGRIRVLQQAPHLKLLDPTNAHHRMFFLEDDRQRPGEDEGKFRGAGNAKVSFRFVPVTRPVWDAVAEIGDYDVPAWEELILDAGELEIGVGPALVLAAAAVETRIATALDVLSHGKMPSEIWQWASVRGGDFTKTPSVSEQLDVLLGALGDRSLKEDARLWEAGVHLRDGRNSFVHEGRPTFGKSKRPVTATKARDLVIASREILDFIEAQLPESSRRPRVESAGELTMSATLQAPPLDT